MEVVAVHVLAHESEHLAGVHDRGRRRVLLGADHRAGGPAAGGDRRAGQGAGGAVRDEVYPRMPDDYRSADCKDGGMLDLHPGLVGLAVSRGLPTRARDIGWAPCLVATDG